MCVGEKAAILALTFSRVMSPVAFYFVNDVSLKEAEKKDSEKSQNIAFSPSTRCGAFSPSNHCG